MTHKYAYEALDRSLRDITGVDALFGGKVVVMLGDFRQVLPVVKRGTEDQIISAALKSSTVIWPYVERRALHKNMRVATAAADDVDELGAFAELLLEVGDGAVPVVMTGATPGAAQRPAALRLPSEGRVDELYGRPRAHGRDLHRRRYCRAGPREPIGQTDLYLPGGRRPEEHGPGVRWASNYSKAPGSPP